MVNTIPVTLPDVIDREITRRAEEIGHSKSDVILDVLREWLEAREHDRAEDGSNSPNAETLAAFADVERNHVNRYTTTDDLYRALGI